jgi:hypothetical protein
VSTTTPVNFTNSGSCAGGESETVTFTIDTAGCTIVGSAQSLGSTCSTSVALTSQSTTSLQLTQGSVPQGGIWYAYLAISCT